MITNISTQAVQTAPARGGNAVHVGRLLHPGFKLQQLNGELVISAIIDGSPADQAGLKIGDAIISIGGHNAGGVYSELSRNPWNSGLRVPVDIVVKRDGTFVNAEVSALPIVSYLDKRWVSFFRPGVALMNAGTAAGRTIGHLHRACTFGLEYVRSGNYLVVSGLADNGSAAQAGVSLGDRISSVNGTPIASVSDAELDRLIDPFSMVAIRLGLVRNSHESVANLEPQSVSSLMFMPIHHSEPRLISGLR